MIYDIPVYMTWSNRQPVTCELIGYFTDEIPDDEVSIKRIDYWGHDDSDLVMKGGNHEDNQKQIENTVGNYLKKFHSKIYRSS